MSELDFNALELKVNQLICLCQQLDERNKVLQTENNTFREQLSQGARQKKHVQTKVESMITRLKSLEQ